MKEKTVQSDGHVGKSETGYFMFCFINIIQTKMGYNG
jgi:hypothetical protein